MSDKSITCIDAFKNLNVIQTGSDMAIAPCCYSPTKPATELDFKNNVYLNTIRDSWNSGVFPSACSNCEYQEKYNGQSRRNGSNQWYHDNGHYDTTVELIRLDYWTGDLCNLRCVICDPRNSSAWKEELKHVIPITNMKVNNIWEQLDLSKIKFIHFNGGEPLLSKEHVTILETIPHKNEVCINYNTNGTIRPSAKLLELWKKFKIVQLDFSIDDVGERFEYQRYPAKWDYVVANLKWFIDHCPVNCLFAVNTSVGVLNNTNLPTLKTWLDDNFYENRLGDTIEHRTQPVNGLFSLKNHELRMNLIIEFLDGCDYRRGTNWRDVFPELT